MSRNLYLGVAFAVIWSLSFIFTQVALKDYPPLWLAGCRLILSGGILYLYIRLYLGRALPLNRKILLAGLFSQAVYLGASYWALVSLPTSIVNIVVSTVPMFSIPMAYFLLAEKPKAYELVSFLLCILGVVVSLWDGILIPDRLNENYLFAILLLAISVLSLSLGNALAKSEMTKENILEFCCQQFSVSGLALLVVSALIEPTPGFSTESGSLFSVLFLVVFGSIIGTIVWFNLLFNMTMIGASSFFILTPMLGIVAGLVFFDEGLSVAKILGAAIISTAIFARVYFGWMRRPERARQ